MAAQQLQEQVLLSFSCTNLPSLDTFSKSDPFIIIYALENDGKQTTKRRVGRTEYIMNNEDPVFSKKFNTVYFFEREQRYCIEVYDVDGEDSGDLNVNVSGFDFIGSAEFALSNVMAGFNSTVDVQLKDKTGKLLTKSSFGSNSPKSMLKIRGDQLQSSQYKMYFQCHGVGLPKGGFFSKDDTQLEVLKKRPDGSEVAIYQSSIVNHNQFPVYQPAKLDVGQLTEGADFDKPIIFRVIRVKSGGKRQVIGEIVKSIRQISPPKDQVQPGEPMITVENLEIPLLEKGKQQGKLLFKYFRVVQEYSFLDYIMGGLQMNFSVCIDFTGSNGDPRSPNSLHYINHGSNQYIDSIRSIGNIVANYAQQQYFVANGFGAVVSIDNGPQHTSHCFPLSLSSQIPYCNGIEDLVRMYVSTIGRLQLSGPTFFEHIINAACTNALRPYTPDLQHWNILLILTDGIINDMAKTVDAIVKASATPLSIIIVGIGSADFSAMSFLDSDDKILTSPILGPAKADIVQFVNFNEYAGQFQALSAATLAEIPDQVTSFMNMNRIKPLQRQQAQQQAAYVPPQ